MKKPKNGKNPKNEKIQKMKKSKKSKKIKNREKPRFSKLMLCFEIKFILIYFPLWKIR